MKIPVQIHAALVTFGALDDFGALVHMTNRVRSFGEAQALVDQFQAFLDSRYKKMALEAHPDRGGDEEQMKAINAARTILKSLKPEPIRPVMPSIIVRFYSSPSGMWNTSTTTTGAW